MRKAVGRGLVVAVLAAIPLFEARAQGGGLTATLRIVSWNVSWFAHPAFPPADDRRQLENVLSVLRYADADVVALQEIASLSAFEELVARLGPAFAGIATRNAGDQELGVIYRRPRVQVLTASDQPLDAAAHDFGDRPPLFVALEIRSAPATDTLLLAVVHLKAFSDPQSYERRLQSVRLLDAYLRTAPRPKHVLVAGDFNDAFDGSTAPGRHSPLRSLDDDTVYYMIPTRQWEDAAQFTYCTAPACDQGAVFDHFVLGRSLDDWSPSARRLVEVLEVVPEFVTTTSDHLPIELTLRPPDGTPRARSPRVIVAAYPSPFKDRLTLTWERGDPVMEVTLVDMLGRVRMRVRTPTDPSASSVVLRTAGLEAGAYILHARGAFHGEGRIVLRIP